MLDCVFADEKVRKALGGALQLKDIDTTDKSQPLLLKMLKQGPGKHIKTHYYEYTKVIKKEMARIRHIQDLQARVVALIGTGIGAVLVGIANFTSTIFYNKITYEQYFPSDAA